MARQQSQHAQVAKIIKLALKKQGIPCKVRSSSFSMGNSVDVNLENQPPWVMDAIKSAFDKYEYGSFDYYQDMQAFKNGDFDGPQTKYLSFNNSISNEIQDEARKYVEDHVNCDQMSDYDISNLTWAYLTDVNCSLGCYFKKELIKYAA